MFGRRRRQRNLKRNLTADELRFTQMKEWIRSGEDRVERCFLKYEPNSYSSRFHLRAFCLTEVKKTLNQHHKAIRKS